MVGIYSNPSECMLVLQSELGHLHLLVEHNKNAMHLCLKQQVMQDMQDRGLGAY